jgi:hypothetical protein
MNVDPDPGPQHCRLPRIEEFPNGKKKITLRSKFYFLAKNNCNINFYYLQIDLQFICVLLWGEVGPNKSLQRP